MRPKNRPMSSVPSIVVFGVCLFLQTSLRALVCESAPQFLVFPHASEHGLALHTCGFAWLKCDLGIAATIQWGCKACRPADFDGLAYVAVRSSRHHHGCWCRRSFQGVWHVSGALTALSFVISVKTKMAKESSNPSRGPSSAVSSSLSPRCLPCGMKSYELLRSPGVGRAVENMFPVVLVLCCGNLCLLFGGPRMRWPFLSRSHSHFVDVLKCCVAAVCSGSTCTTCSRHLCKLPKVFRPKSTTLFSFSNGASHAPTARVCVVTGCLCACGVPHGTPSPLAKYVCEPLIDGCGIFPC